MDDAAQALGATLHGRPCGTLGDAGLFSLDKGKNVSAIDGGAIVTDDRIESLRRFRDDVREVKEGQECGIGLGASVTVQEGDILEVIGEKSTRRIL